MNKTTNTIKNLEARLKKVKKSAASKVLQKIRKSEKAGIVSDLPSSILKKLINNKEVTVWQDDAEQYSRALKRFNIQHEVHIVFREVDPYSYWPGDEISGYRTINLV